MKHKELHMLKSYQSQNLPSEAKTISGDPVRCVSTVHTGCEQLSVPCMDIGDPLKDVIKAVAQVRR